MAIILLVIIPLGGREGGREQAAGAGRGAGGCRDYLGVLYIIAITASSSHRRRLT